MFFSEHSRYSQISSLKENGLPFLEENTLILQIAEKIRYIYSVFYCVSLFIFFSHIAKVKLKMTGCSKGYLKEFYNDIQPYVEKLFFEILGCTSVVCIWLTQTNKIQIDKTQNQINKTQTQADKHKQTKCKLKRQNTNPTENFLGSY